MMTNGTATFIAACLGILVLEMTLVLGALAVLFLRLSRAAAAVERAVREAEEKFLSISTLWVRVVQGAGGLLSGFMSGREHSRFARDARASARAEEARAAT